MASLESEIISVTRFPLAIIYCPEAVTLLNVTVPDFESTELAAVTAVQHPVALVSLVYNVRTDGSDSSEDDSVSLMLKVILASNDTSFGNLYHENIILQKRAAILLATNPIILTRHFLAKNSIFSLTFNPCLPC